MTDPAIREQLEWWKGHGWSPRTVLRSAFGIDVPEDDEPTWVCVEIIAGLKYAALLEQMLECGKAERKIRRAA